MVYKCKKKQEMHKIPICFTDTCLFLSFLHFKIYTNIHSYTVSKLRSSSLHLHQSILGCRCLMGIQSLTPTTSNSGEKNIFLIGTNLEQDQAEGTLLLMGGPVKEEEKRRRGSHIHGNNNLFTDIITWKQFRRHGMFQ